MKVSTKVEYGLIALSDIAIHSEKGVSVPGPEIADRQNISRKYLEQILTALRQGGFIRAQKGVRGGYTLACRPEEVTLYDVLNSLDSTLFEEPKEAGEETDSELRHIVNACFWKELNRQLTAFAKNKTLAEFVSQCREQISGGWDLYII